jgi:hypothetical protein
MRVVPRLAAGLTAFGLLAAPMIGAAVGAQTGSLEYEVKAAFLYNFARFVQWPAHRFASADAPLTICVYGSDPFGPVLDQTVRVERVNGRPIALARPDTPAAANACHILFVSDKEEPRFGEVLSRLDRHVVLTVGDVPSFLAAGGHLSFFLDGNRVRFAVNTEALRDCQFQISSKLLRLARTPPAPQEGR